MSVNHSAFLGYGYILNGEQMERLRDAWPEVKDYEVMINAYDEDTNFFVGTRVASVEEGYYTNIVEKFSTLTFECSEVRQKIREVFPGDLTICRESFQLLSVVD